MPSKSEKQRRAAGVALSAKRRGSSKGLHSSSKSMYESMSEDELEDFASKAVLEKQPKAGGAWVGDVSRPIEDAKQKVRIKRITGLKKSDLVSRYEDMAEVELMDFITKSIDVYLERVGVRDD